MAKNGFSQNGEVGKLPVWPRKFDMHFPHACLPIPTSARQSSQRIPKED